VRITGSKIGTTIGIVSKVEMVKGTRTSSPRISKTRIKRKMTRKYP
jgi:hypothetical protein